MPGQTEPTFHWPIPGPQDAADGPGAFKMLGDGIDETLSGRLKDSPEITSDANGQHLTGTRVGGDWNVPDGSVHVGQVGVGSARDLFSTHRYGPNEYISGFGPTVTSGIVGTGLKLWVNGAVRMTLQITEQGNVGTRDYPSLVDRPLPFGMWATSYGFNMNNQAIVTQPPVTYPTGRFTQVPLVFATAIHASGAFYAWTGQPTLTAVSVGISHYQNVVSASNVGIFMMVLQMASGSAPGLRAEPPYNATVTCHTEDCENGEVDIPMHMPEGSTVALCGVCSQTITDVRWS